MAEKLQGLLDRINEEGLKKADAEREQILSSARAEAERIVKKAQEDAEALKASAQGEADMLLQKGQQSLQQAARDTLLSLRTQLQERMGTVATATVAEALSPDALGTIIAELVKAYLAKGETVEQLSVLLPEDKLKAVEQTLLKGLGDALKAKPELAPLAGAAEGFKLSFNGADVMYDFTDEALAETLCVFLNPKLADLVRSA